MSQTKPKDQSQLTTPEPTALVQRYEKSLAPYQRMKGRWTFQIEKSKPDEVQKHPEATEEWAVFRDRGRLRLVQTTDSEKGHEVFESLFQPEQEVSVFADGVILGWLKPSAQAETNMLGGSLCAPCYGFIDQKWIPDFLRTAKLSVQAETIDGHAVFRLRSLTLDTKIELWIDPAPRRCCATDPFRQTGLRSRPVRPLASA